MQQVKRRVRRRTQDALAQYGTAALQIIVMAAAYELYDSPVASDNSYDLICKMYEGGRIPGFDPSTGQWVHKLMTEDIHELTRYCIERVRQADDEHCHHTYIWDYYGRQE